MAELEPVFEVLETRILRAWMNRDTRELKSLIASDCLFMFGTTPPALLDRPSLLAGIESGLRCNGFQFKEMTARQYGKAVWFSGHVELQLSVTGQDWSGAFMLTDLWRKTGLKRNWKLAERSLAPLKGDGQMSGAIRSLQLWR